MDKTKSLLTACTIAAAVLVLIPDGTGREEPAPRPAPAVQAPEMAEVPLADVIAAQGNAALVQIRAESTQLASLKLKQVAVEGRSE